MMANKWISRRDGDVFAAEDPYSVKRENGVVTGYIDMYHSPDEGGWFAEEFDLKRRPGSTRVSKKIYRHRLALMEALQSGEHLWTKWD